MKNSIFTIALTLIVACASAQLVNGGIDSTFNGWTTIGNSTSNPAATGPLAQQPFMVSNFGPSIVPQYGSHMAQLTGGGTVNVSSLDTFAALNPGTIAATQALNPVAGAAMKQTFFAQSGQRLRIKVLFTTTEDPFNWDPNNNQPGGWNYNDFCFYSVSNSTTNYAQMIANQATLYNYSLSYGAPSTHVWNGHYAYNSWIEIMIDLNTTDFYTFSIGVLDVGDTLFHSDVLVDYALLNTRPISGNLVYSGVMNQQIDLAATDFQSVYTDPDPVFNFSTGGIQFTVPPRNGYLIWLTPSGEDTLSLTNFWPLMTMADMDSIVYRPFGSYLGPDSCYFDATDGLDYTMSSTKINFDISIGLGFLQPDLNTVSAYPTPASDQINFRFAHATSGTIQFYNIAGELITQETISNAETATINASSFPNGMYTYIIRTTDGNNLTGRHVIVH